MSTFEMVVGCLSGLVFGGFCITRAVLFYQLCRQEAISEGLIGDSRKKGLNFPSLVGLGLAAIMAFGLAAIGVYFVSLGVISLFGYKWP